MKKYFKKSELNHGKWSDGFSDTKDGKSNKKNKPKSNDDVEIDDNTVLLIDESVEVKSLTGNHLKLFAIKGASLKVDGKKLV